MELLGKTCIVTGGASGIGLAVATLFIGNGANVVLADNSPDTLRESTERLGDRALGIACDVSNGEQVAQMVEQTYQTFGAIDVLVNNAGFGFRGNVTTITEADWDRLMAVNVKGIFLCSKHVVPIMARQQKGSIINTTSYTATAAIADRTAYVASKGAISALTRAMALDHAKQGIRVNGVAPGTTDSPYFNKIFASAEDPAQLRSAYEARAVLNRMGTPEEVAEAFLFLASDRSKFATGSIITVDGGSSIGNHLVA